MPNELIKAAEEGNLDAVRGILAEEKEKNPAVKQIDGRNDEGYPIILALIKKLHALNKQQADAKATADIQQRKKKTILPS